MFTYREVTRAIHLGSVLAALACSSEDKDSGAKQQPSQEGGSCTSPVGSDSAKQKRASCNFEAGAHVGDTLGISEAERKKIPIEHVIVMMKENRSYDQLFGQLSKIDPKYEGIPDSFSNKDANGNDVKPFHATTTCFPNDPEHQWVEMHNQVNGGKMDGFVKSAATSSSPANSDGHYVMGYYEESDLPFYYFLAKTFALADRNFPSVLSGTWPNRDYLYAATSDGVTFTNFPCDATKDGCVPHVKTIFDVMTDAGVTWGAFTDSAPLSFALEWTGTHEGVHTMQDLYDGLASGTLPSVAFVDGRIGGVGLQGAEDDHPTADLQAGEKWSKTIYDAAVKSPLWDKLVIFYTYDEAGAFFDHVPPPPYDADKTTVCIARPDSGATAHPDTEFFELGIRVPLVAISPWAKRGFVSHVQHEHTSITRFIELLFDLPALTARDANSDALLDMFDFGCKNENPIPTAPEPGSGGCVQATSDAGGTDAGP